MIYLKTIVLLTGIFSMTSCHSRSEVSGKNLQIEIGAKLTFGFNENIETLALIYNLSASGNYHFNKIPGPRASLAKKLTEQFEEFRSHEAVIKLNKLLDDGIVDMYDILLGLYNTSLPDFKQFAKYPAVYYENDSLTAEQIQARFDDFNQSVIKFYQEANLQTRFKNEFKPLYQKILAEAQSAVQIDRFIEAAETYYGVFRDRYEIIVSAFSFNGIGRAILINSNEGSKAVCLVTSNHLVESDTINLNNLNNFTVGYKDEKYFREVGLHELIHTFLHEEFKENQETIALIKKLNYLFTDSLKNDMAKQGYTDWVTCFEEHLVRIGEIKIAALMGDNQFIASYRKECIEKRRFIYFELIENLLLKYDNNRTRYKKFSGFIPLLLAELEINIPAIVPG